MTSASPAAAAADDTRHVRVPTFAMAVAAGIAVATLYYNQPMLGLIEATFSESASAGLVPTASQIGYALGLFFLVPLGDMIDRRRLIVGQFLALAAALVVAAAAPSATVLILGSALTGIAATTAQQIIPFAATLARPERRGATIGTVMSGLLCGILLSRTVAGFVATHFGWRAMFWAAVPLALLAAALMAFALPAGRPTADLRYPAALRSLAHLWTGEPRLRLATATQAALFASFSAFWTVLALRLQEPQFGLGADVAGLFGVVGAMGVLAAPLAGRLADRRGPGFIIAVGVSLVLAAWFFFGFWAGLAGLAIGVVLLDLGVQGSMVPNQHMIYALRPEARSRINTVFMTGIFVGGALGSLGATFAYGFGGWHGVCLLGGGLALVSCLLQAVGARNRRSGPAH